MDRITLLPGVLLAAKNTVLQVSGEEKADALEHVLRGPEDWMQYPCQIASRDERATWFLDRAAAQKFVVRILLFFARLYSPLRLDNPPITKPSIA